MDQGRRSYRQRSKRATQQRRTTDLAQQSRLVHEELNAVQQAHAQLANDTAMLEAYNVLLMQQVDALQAELEQRRLLGKKASDVPVHLLGIPVLPVVVAPVQVPDAPVSRKVLAAAGAVVRAGAPPAPAASSAGNVTVASVATPVLEDTRAKADTDEEPVAAEAGGSADARATSE